jgi:hypothetical protein
LTKIISLSVSIFFIYLCIKDIPLKMLLSEINLRIDLIFLSVLLLYFVNILKAYRLKYLLNNYKKKKFRFYFKPLLIRQFVNATFFGNLGEFVMPLFFKKYFRITYVEGFSITLIERFLDLTFISLIFGFFLYFNDLEIYNSIIFIYFFGFFTLLLLTLYIMQSNNIFLNKLKIIKQLRTGYKKSFKRNKFIYKIITLSFLIWTVFIIIDLFLFNAFEVTSKISSLPNIIFITGVIMISQFIPSAPSSIGVFNYLIIETIAKFYEVLNLEFTLKAQVELTSISMIILVIYILPDITWGAYLFFKETNLNLSKIKNYSIRYTK